MTTENLEQIALRVAREMNLWDGVTGIRPEEQIDFAHRLVAELTKGQEPAGYIVQEETPDGIGYGYSADYPQAVHDHINDVIQRCVDNDIKPSVMHCIAFFTAPPLPPEGWVMVANAAFAKVKE